jgi:hypothetical protein
VKDGFSDFGEIAAAGVLTIVGIEGGDGGRSFRGWSEGDWGLFIEKTKT